MAGFNRFGTACLLFLLFTGCAPAVVRNYQGSPRLQTEVAVLYNTRELGIIVYEIDHKYVLNHLTNYDPDAWKQVELEPGTHTLSGAVYVPGKYAVFVEDFEFDAGKKYQLVFETIENIEKVKVALKEVN